MTTARGSEATHAGMRSREAGERFGVFGVGTHLLGVPCAAVQEMFVLKEIHRPTGMAAMQRGVAVLRGRSLPAIDQRHCLGLTTAREELEALVRLLDEREQDHVAWLDDLAASVAEKRPFKLATDPHLCKFGRWYYAFHSDDPVLRGELARFEAPHAEIHGIARQVKGLEEAGKIDEANQLLETTRGGRLAELRRLFDSTRGAIRAQQREIGVTVRCAGRDVVLTVDRAEAVTELELVSGEDDPVQLGALDPEFVAGMARWRENKQPVLLLDMERVARVVG